MKRMNAIVVIAAAAVAFAAAVAQSGTMYKWVSKDGKVSYHDQPPPSASDYRVEEKKLGSKDRTEPTGAVEKSPVVLYSAPKCASCDLARIYLEKRKIPFTEKNVESDPKLQEELKAKAGTLSVPTILVGEKVMSGYLESLLEGELNAAGYPKTEAATEKTEKPAP